MISMTGFGYGEYNDEDYTISVEVKSYNNRFLDLNLSLPPFLSQLEEKIRQETTKRVRRGRVELYLKLKAFNEDTEIIIDKKSLEAHVKALHELNTLAGLRDELHLSHLLRLEGILKTYRTVDQEKMWNLLGPVLHQALDRLIDSRRMEGEKLELDISGMVDKIGAQADRIESLVPEIEKKIRLTVTQKFDELLGKDIDESRVLSEIAALVIRFDINEEVVRIKTHLENFRKSMTDDELPGKKLDFICQELNREINTISAKSLLIEMNNAAIVIKELIERIREQLRNVE
jgi:uncharacterized protein (TIGR00255 family)